jgi:tungstate transport system substrate-binding protein
MIAETAVPFVSRGDDSGTHTKEKVIWAEAGIEPAGDWYISAGQGMGAVLTMADEQQAYTLSDRATYLARTLEGINLDIMVEGDPILFNPYGVIAVNPDKGGHIQADLANQFIDWLNSLTTQELIAQFGVEAFGAPLFTPDSAAWREASGGVTAEEPAEAAEPQSLILATTTSTDNSGLLAYILPVFEEQYNVTIDVVAVGTGQALQLGEDGNADVLLVHARAREDAFMDAGHGSRREDVMYNDFVILGPEADPAGIWGKNKASRAFELIAEAEAAFVSRGDDSGTHTKELAIWAEAGIEPAGDWYIAAGQSMGAVLTMADEQQAYTLSDRATYLARTLEGIDLGIMVEGDPILFNPYGVIAVNPDKGEHIKADLADLFIEWLTSVTTQELIAEFGVAEFGAPLFTPDSALWREIMGTAVPNSDVADADLRVTGEVKTELGWSEAEVRGMEPMEADAVNNSGETETYVGVSINMLLEMAEVKSRATAVTILDADGNSIEIPLADLQACTDCILSFRNQGGFSTTLPAFPDLPRLRGVVEIQVK